MDEELKKAAEAAKSGKAEPFQALVKILRAGPPAPIREMLEATEPVLRRAAILAAKGRPDPALLGAVAGLASDADVSVRRSLAESIGDEPGEKVDAALLELLDDDDEGVRAAAAKASRKRKVLEPGLLGRLPESNETAWKVRQSIAEALGGHSVKVMTPLLEALATDTARAVQQAAAQSLEEFFKANDGAWPAAAQKPEHAMMEQASQKLAAIGTRKYATLNGWLEKSLATEIDVKKLRDFGADLTTEAEEGRIPRAYGTEEVCEELEKVLLKGSVRAAVLLGDAGVGKTAIVHELVHRIRAKGYRVLRFSPVELLAGTKYLGEWQTKLNDMVRAVKSPRKVILYCPNLQELSDAGRTSVSDINMATALAPRVESGEIAILGESSSEAFRAGLGAIGSLRRLFHSVEVQEADIPRTHAILEWMQNEAKANVPPKVIGRLLELADYYLSGTSQPGRAAGLFRRVLESGAGRTTPMTSRDVLKTLSASTGVPIDLLDDEVSLDVAGVRGFFEARVMGQPEAIDSVTDVVTLVKAGLTDPTKPFGVFLFVGPTGVGKTELARALAEYLFGEAKRLIRFDMSEFATYDAFERLIGRGMQPGLLTAAVRERPFSVVLLDEIEKAHANVFDLCLQLFDAGRLTDSLGRTADFRRTIVILTSNVGSRMQNEAPLGFGGEQKGGTPTQDAILRELSRFFRPEFLNRLDRVVIFRQLAIETAEKIARREVSKVVERSGIARRGLVVDVDPAALALLLKEGYSPHFGARPLKRTVERMVLLPVARAISAGGVPPGTLLRLVARGDKIEVEAASMDAAGAERPNLVEVRLDERAAALTTEVAQLRSRAQPVAMRKTELLALSGTNGFWNDPVTARRVLDEIHRLDGVLEALDSLESAVLTASERAARKPTKERDLARQTERLDALEAEAARVSFLLSCRDARDLGNAFLALTLVKSQGAGLSAVEKLAAMYAGLAKRRGLDVEVIDDRRGGEPHEDTITLQLSGAGAYATLAGETGLHQVVRGAPSNRKEGVREDRNVVRVEVLPVPADAAAFARADLRIEARPLKGVKGRMIDKLAFDVHLVHAPSMASVRAWTSGAKAEAIERLEPLLRARVDGGRDGAGGANVVRRYTLGPSPLVRDQRSGRTTGRLEDVLEGDLGAFLQLPGAGRNGGSGATSL